MLIPTLQMRKVSFTKSGDFPKVTVSTLWRQGFGFKALNHILISGYVSSLGKKKTRPTVRFDYSHPTQETQKAMLSTCTKLAIHRESENHVHNCL